MAATPEWKVHNAAGEYKAACKDIEDAACLVGLYGHGAYIANRWRYKGKIWHEGYESVSASESYDEVARTVWRRCEKYSAECEAKRGTVVA